MNCCSVTLLDRTAQHHNNNNRPAKAASKPAVSIVCVSGVGAAPKATFPSLTHSIGGVSFVSLAWSCTTTALSLCRDSINLCWLLLLRAVVVLVLNVQAPSPRRASPASLVRMLTRRRLLWSAAAVDAAAVEVAHWIHFFGEG